jgi:hypothetical protein
MVIYCCKYGFVEIWKYFVHLFVLFLCTKDVTFLFVIHISSLSSYLYYFHRVLRISVYMSRVYYVLCMCGCVFVVFYCSYIFVKSCFERTFCLADIFYGTILALETICTNIFLLIIIIILLLYSHVFLCGAGSFICYFYAGVLKYVGHLSDFFSEVRVCMFSSSLQYQKVDKVQKPSNSERNSMFMITIIIIIIIISSLYQII